MWSVASIEPLLPASASLRQSAAVLIGLAGVTLDSLALFAFLSRRTTINPLRPDRTSALVTDGVYRITRNPMYLGLALLLTAWATALGSLWAFLGPVAFVLYITRFQIQPEERALRNRFGDEFTRYAARVRRWI